MNYLNIDKAIEEDLVKAYWAWEYYISMAPYKDQNGNRVIPAPTQELWEQLGFNSSLILKELPEIRKKIEITILENRLNTLKKELDK